MYVKRDFAGVIKLRLLSWQIILDYISRLSVITRVLIGGRQEAQSGSRKTGNVKKEAKMGMMQPGAKG